MKHPLLATTSMTPAERKAGRFLRAPDHPSGEATEGTGEGTAVQQLSGGVTRVTPDGDAAAAAKANADSVGGVQEDGQKPADKAAEVQLPEGYDSWEAYGRAVAEGKAQAPKPAEDASQKEGTKPEGADAALAEFTAKAEPFTKEFEETGALSAESVAKAAETFGVPEEAVRQYLAGASAEATAAALPFYEQAGGKDAYGEFQAWSVEGMTEAEQKALNDAYAGNNPEAALTLQQKFVDRWKAEGGGKSPRDLTKEALGGEGRGADVYESWAQVKQDMNDPRYTGQGGRKDEAFIRDVEAKIGRSPLP